MESDPHSVHRYDRARGHLVEIKIFLINPGTSPNLVNPDFLRHNNIVDPSWSIVHPVMMESGSSRIQYANGLSLSAYNDQIIVTQRARTNGEELSIIPLTSQNIVCFEVAAQYLQSVSPESPYDIVSIDPMLYVELRTEGDHRATSPLRALATRIPFNDVIPVVHARAQYKFPQKDISVYVSELVSEDRDEVTHLVFAGEILRKVVGDKETQVSFINNVLSQWEQDIDDFNELTQQFYSMYVQGER